MEIDRLLSDVECGNNEACIRLYSLVYTRLLKLAEQQIYREYSDDTISPQEIVHEMFEKMIRQKSFQINNLGHFFAISVRSMQQILVDHARKQNSRKNGSNWTRIDMDLRDFSADSSPAETPALHQVLQDLRLYDIDCYQIVQLRFFAGFTIWETACTMGLSTSTVNRYWRKARCWMRNQMSEP